MEKVSLMIQQERQILRFPSCNFDTPIQVVVIHPYIVTRSPQAKQILEVRKKVWYKISDEKINEYELTKIKVIFRHFYNGTMSKKGNITNFIKATKSSMEICVRV